MKSSTMGILLVVFFAAPVLLFQNCSGTLKPAGGAVETSTKGSANSGTSTDNPMAAVQLDFGKFNSNVTTSLCISGSEFSAGTKATPSIAVSPTDWANYADPFAAITNPFPTSYTLSQPDLSQYMANLVALEQAMVNSLFIAELMPEGTVIGQQQVSFGAYHQITLHLTPGCSSNASLVVQNAAGTFSTTSPIDLVFVGNLSVDPNVTLVTLDISNQLSELANVTSDTQIGSALQGQVGAIH
jgi:hypothetical protein